MRANAVHDTIRLIYAAALGRQSWSTTLGAVAEATGARFASLLRYPLDPERPHLCSPGQESFIETYFEDEWHIRCPRVHVIAKSLTDPYFGARIITDEVVGTLHENALRGFYKEFLNPVGFGDFAGTLLSLGEGRRAVLILDRNAGTGAFSSDELAGIALFTDHLEMSLALVDRATLASSDAVAWSAALDDAGVAAIFLTADGFVVRTTQWADRILSDGLRIVGGRLRCRSPDSQSALDRMLVERPPRRSVRIPRDHGQRPLLARAVPVDEASSEPEWVFARGPVATILILVDPDPRRRHSTAIDALILLGLPPSEAQVAALVGAGMTAAQVARELGLTEATVRTYLKWIYSKLEITRQVQLVELVSRIGPATPLSTE
ncbi:MAG: helix-turn-helix transcriptional regulator [Bauldia sp.]|nr:helix-turn-helix transcriptional regulator [Bauldia sp.]